MSLSLQQTILEKKAALADAAGAVLGRIADAATGAWSDADALDQILAKSIAEVPHCHLLYAWDVHGVEVSSMVSRERIDPSWRGRDLSQRPYLKNHLPFKGIMLSSVYESAYTHKQCVTALQAVNRGAKLLGFIAADFALSELLQDALLTTPAISWKQFRGDPAVRGTVFMQSRAQSLLDEHIDAVLARVENLMREHGIFHSKIHFSSGRCSFWLYEDPYNYRIHTVDELIDPEICLAYPARPYQPKAKVRPEVIMRVFKQFKALRFADETIYLRSSSINVINGMLGLTFSCDGSHYMPVEEFLDKDLGFWVGEAAATAAALGGAPTAERA